MKIKTKLIGGIIIWVIIANIFFLIIFIQNQKNVELSELQEKIKKTSILLNQVNSGPLYDLDVKKLQTNLQSFLKDPELVSISLIEYNGSINLHYESTDLKFEKNIKDKTILIHNAHEIGEINTIYSTYVIQKKINKFIIHILEFVLILILGISLVSYIIIKKITKPLSSLTEIMDDVVLKENFTIRTVIKSNDEVGSLCKDFNTMLDHIEENRRAIKKNESDLKKAQQIAHLGNWEWDIDQDKFYISDEMQQIYGINNEKYTITGIQDLVDPFIHPNDKEMINRAVNKLKDDKIGEFLEYRIIRQDNQEIRWISASAPVIEQKNNNSFVFGTIQDITERKQAEVELRHLRNYLGNIIDSMPSVLIGVDAEFKVTQWNKTAEKQTGINANNANGKIITDLLPSLISEMSKIKESIRSRETKQNQKKPSNKDGEIFYEDITIYPLITNGVEGAVIRIDDVTEKIRMEEMMIQSEKMLSVGGLAAGMAHEINNPLAGIMQNVQVIKNRLSTSSLKNKTVAKKNNTNFDSILNFMKDRKIFTMLDMVHESGDRASKIVKNMLSFSRKSEHTSELNNITKIIDNTLDLASNDYDLKKKYDFRKIKIIKDYQEEIPLIRCEFSKLQQVFLNIFKNGAEAMAEENKKKDKKELKSPQFHIRVNKFDKILQIEIEDNGPGISKKNQNRIFEPFFTTKKVGTGTGLGLSVSYFIIIEDHGGEMRVESEEGIGTKFIIRLPIERNKLKFDIEYSK